MQVLGLFEIFRTQSHSAKCRVRNNMLPMTSLLEIEEAADVLSVEEKKEVVAFLLARLRGVGDELPPRA